MAIYYISHRKARIAASAVRHASAKLPEPGQIIDPEEEYEIQILDEAGRSKKPLYFSSDSIKQSSANRNCPVPDAVLDAVRKLSTGVAVYVNESGHEVSPF